MTAPVPVLAQVTSRAATAADETFLFDLYSAVRGPELAHLPLPQGQRSQLMKMQYTWQTNAYRAAYPESNYEIVILDNEPVGRLWVARSDVRLHLVDIALHPSFQNRGIGTVLLRRLQTEACKYRKQIVSSVVRFNTGSLRFHLRLGFRVVADDEMTLSLVWNAEQL